MQIRLPLKALLLAGVALPIVACTNSPQLTSIVISPASYTTTIVLLPNGEPAPTSEQLTTKYKAIGYYSHGSHPPKTVDITGQVTWFSYTPDLVTVSSSGVATVTGIDVGFSSIIASMQGFNGDIVSNTSTFTVNLPSTTPTSPATSLLVGPTGTAASTVGAEQAFTLMSRAESGSTQNLSGGVTWKSSNPEVLTIDPSTGVGKVVGYGSSYVIATYKSGRGIPVTASTEFKLSAGN